MITKKLTKYTYTMVYAPEYGAPTAKTVETYEPLKLRDIYAEFRAMGRPKPIVTCKKEVQKWQISGEDFFSAARKL